MWAAVDHGGILSLECFKVQRVPAMQTPCVSEDSWQGEEQATAEALDAASKILLSAPELAVRRTPEGYRILSLDTSRNVDLCSGGCGQIDEHIYNSFMSQLDECDVEEDIAIDLCSHGGDMFFISMIANALAEHGGITVARIRRTLTSGATLIALACKKIVMAPTACLGPLSFHKYLPYKCVLPALDLHKDDSAMCRAAQTIIENYTNDNLVKIQDILTELYSEEELDEVLDFFYHSHDFQLPLFPRNISSALPFLELQVDSSLRIISKKADSKEV